MWISHPRFPLFLRPSMSETLTPLNADNISIGRGKMMVEFFSEEMEFSVWRYLSCKAAGDELIVSAASFKALLDFCSPSAATTLALASLVASASAAMALCSCCGRRTSLISTLWTWTPHGSVASSRLWCIPSAMFSLSDKISERFLVPRTFLEIENSLSALSIILSSHTWEWFVLKDE